MEVKILSLITKLQVICLPWSDATPIDENDWYYIADDMAEMLPNFLRYAKQDYAQHITPPLIEELAKWLTTVMSICPKDTQHQFAEFWNELFWESYLWMGWIKQYYPALSESRDMATLDLCEPAEVTPPTPQDAAQPLPSAHPLNSRQAQRIFEDMSKHGFIVRDGSKWKWASKAINYGYFVYRMNRHFNLFKGRKTRRINWEVFASIIVNADKMRKSCKTQMSNYMGGDNILPADSNEKKAIESIILNKRR